MHGVKTGEQIRHRAHVRHVALDDPEGHRHARLVRIQHRQVEHHLILPFLGRGKETVWIVLCFGLAGGRVVAEVLALICRAYERGEQLSARGVVVAQRHKQIRQILLGHKPQIRQRVLLAEARVEPCGVLSQNEPAVSHRQDLRRSLRSVGLAEEPRDPRAFCRGVENGHRACQAFKDRSAV